MLLTGLLAALIAASSPRPIACLPTVGLESVLTSKVRWLIVGEPHGTNQVPEAFADLVCDISRRRRVTVAVEQPVSEQIAIDKFTLSDGGVEARAAFLQSAIWTNGFKDGRSSRAMFQLFERLRTLRREGRISRVVAFQPIEAKGAAAFEQAMADRLARQLVKGDLIVALVGNVHASTKAVSFDGPAYLPMAALLPRHRTVALDAQLIGGEQWACISMTECGAQKIDIIGQPRRRIIIGAKSSSSYTGVFNIGVAATASPPQ